MFFGLIAALAFTGPALPARDETSLIVSRLPRLKHRGPNWLRGALRR